MNLPNERVFLFNVNLHVQEVGFTIKQPFVILSTNVDTNITKPLVQQMLIGNCCLQFSVCCQTPNHIRTLNLTKSKIIPYS